MSRNFYQYEKDLSGGMLWVGSEALGMKPGWKAKRLTLSSTLNSPDLLSENTSTQKTHTGKHTSINSQPDPTKIVFLFPKSIQNPMFTPSQTCTNTNKHIETHTASFPHSHTHTHSFFAHTASNIPKHTYTQPSALISSDLWLFNIQEY